MILKYQLTEEDFINYNVFISNHSASVQKMKQRVRLLFLLAFMILSAVLYYHDRTQGIICVVIAMVSFAVFPLFFNKLYNSVYSNAIRGSFKGRTGVPIYLEISETSLLVASKGAENTFAPDQVGSITELPTLILVRLKKGDNIIVAQKGIAHIDKIKAELRELSNKWGVPYRQVAG
jgi:hypothetical protein